jgi:hypothetical protein
MNGIVIATKDKETIKKQREVVFFCQWID